MASQMEKPTLLLVQGSFQLPEVYERLVKALEHQGYPVVHPSLPSLTNHDDPDFASKTLADDSRAIREQLDVLIVQQKKKVVLVMHSYGGLVGPNAFGAELSFASRKKHGDTGGVVHLFFFAAFILEVGQSIFGAFGESPSNDVRPKGRFRIKDAGAKLYSDLSKEEAKLWEAKIIDQSYAVQTTQLTQTAYQYVESTYVVSDLDMAVPPQYQEMFATRAKADVRRIDAGHSPMLSKTEELVAIITSTVEKACL